MIFDVNQRRVYMGSICHELQPLIVSIAPVDLRAV